jgi:RimJ/RimL family protein N-acetyltransferase
MAAIARTFDARRLNALASLTGNPVDLSCFVADEKHIALAWERGSYLFLWTAPHTYEVHIAVLPDGRGREAYRMAREAISYMASIGAEKLWARVRPDAPQIRHFASSAGFKRCGSDRLDLGNGPIPFDLYELKLCPKPQSLH